MKNKKEQEWPKIWLIAIRLFDILLDKGAFKLKKKKSLKLNMKEIFVVIPCAFAFGPLIVFLQMQKKFAFKDPACIACESEDIAFFTILICSGIICVYGISLFDKWLKSDRQSKEVFTKDSVSPKDLLMYFIGAVAISALLVIDSIHSRIELHENEIVKYNSMNAVASKIKFDENTLFKIGVEKRSSHRSSSYFIVYVAIKQEDEETTFKIFRNLQEKLEFFQRKAAKWRLRIDKQYADDFFKDECEKMSETEKSLFNEIFSN